MSDVAIRVENLGKEYRIGRTQAGYQTIRETLMDTLQAPLRRASKLLRGQATGAAELDETFWALQNISFEIKHGEAVGLIGRNGAGKSTLLKLLSRITEPTQGAIDLYGRVGSLLEVGTGFHPELTGRENIYLNGAILGMSRAYINRQLDEIISFAEVEKFIDTPVKHYSSGMYLRLAFAVAAHLEPEILLVDEVLAVGDAEFQKKCLGKMDEMAQHGRTIVFVSHQMSAVTRLTTRAILLEQGKALLDGPPNQVIGEYLHSGYGRMAQQEWLDMNLAPGNDVAKLRAVRIRLTSGEIGNSSDIRENLNIEMEYNVLKDDYLLTPNIHLHNEQGICVFVTTDQNPEWRSKPRFAGKYISTVHIPGNFLAEGTFFVDVALSTMSRGVAHIYEKNVVAFEVVDSHNGDSARGDYVGEIPGVVRPLLPWTNQYIGDEDSIHVVQQV